MLLVLHARLSEVKIQMAVGNKGLKTNATALGPNEH